jgi:hypothetical protein
MIHYIPNNVGEFGNFLKISVKIAVELDIVCDIKIIEKTGNQQTDNLAIFLNFVDKIVKSRFKNRIQR